MAAVDEQRSSEDPGERRLPRPPSERYVAPTVESAPDAAEPRSRRPLVLAALVAIVGAVAITLAGGFLAMTAGLLVIAAAIGWAVGAGLKPGVALARRRWMAATLAIVSVLLGQVGLWLVARQEGGTLGFVAYLAEVFGLLVPAQLALAALVAWWQAR